MTALTTDDRSERASRVISLYRDGGTIRGMGQELRLPHRVIRNALRDEGIAVRRRVT